ncbi:hypothetical protein K503DRAFT_867853 [Rhizopogon vinicolor AM-OR11-026]|uniref:Uncharacterized protein n=1 Tax=Rhizopogon vinicolor AM-OR11-026 TaxID=1314800 RepID=A0A1B7MTU6_9AGAM|nr:hypothetical protein K503DRAFT_867853 [Rhizopogon vinicolor AM-OR11-026]
MSIPMDRVHTLASRPSPASTYVQMSAPSNATASGTEKPPSPENSAAGSNDEKQSQMEQSLKRSITLVIWYKQACDPIRLNHEISTFPLFQLSHFPSVVSDLELTSASYLDTYNNATGNWEQHMITTVRTIETDQRLLYKLRKSLLSGLSDDECQGLAEELALQSKKKQAASPTILVQHSMKRPATEHVDGPPAKRLYPEGYPHPMYIPPMGYMYPSVSIGHAMNTHTGPSNANSPEGEVSSSMLIPYSVPATPMGGQPPSSPGQFPIVSPSSATRAGSGASFPQHPHPPLKRWPNDYTVSEIAAGFRQMDALIAQTPNSTQRVAFERVFGCRYVKSTVCRHRGVYRKADGAIRSMFEGMGTDERAVWGEFVRRVEGRPSGKPAQGEQGEEAVLQGDIHERGPQSSPVQQEQCGETTTVPLMDSLGQSPHMIVASPPSSIQHTNGHVPVYDPSLADKGVGLAET